MNGDNIHNTQGERMTICEIIVFVAILVVALMVLWPRHEAQPVNRGGVVRERNSATIVGPIMGVHT